MIKKFFALIRIQFKNDFVYRISTVAGIIVGIVQIYIYYHIWNTVYDNVDSINGYSLPMISFYVVISNLIFKLVELGITLKISDEIRLGEIAVKITKPINYVSSLLCEGIGSLAGKLLTLVVPTSVFCLIGIRVYAQTDIKVVFFFIVSVFLAILISVYIDILFGLMTFITENGWGIRTLRQALIRLLSGAIIPLNFFPGAVQKICDFLPFKSLIDTPINIYLFGFTKTNLLNFVQQLIWVVVLFSVVHLVFYKIKNTLQVNGG